MKIFMTTKLILVMASLLFSAAAGLAQNIFINEFLASNVTVNPDNIDFDDYSDWLELYNGEAFSVNLSGYFLTDNLNQPLKWPIPQGTTIPAGGFLRIWADGFDERPGVAYVREDEPNNTYFTQYYHSNFKLSLEGEEIALFSPDTVLIDSIIYTLQIADISYGRQPDGSVNWLYFGEPTPGSSNNTTGTLSRAFSESVQFSTEGGVFNSAQSVTLSVPSANTSIYYTLDGSKPGTAGSLYNAPINISNTTVIRARAFEEGRLPGPVITQTYLINEAHSLPVLALSVYPETVFGSDYGIFPNLLKSREMPVSVEFFETDGQRVLQDNAGIRLSGQASFRYPQKPLTISTADRFGSETLTYQFFPSRNVNTFSSVYMRNSGTPDNRITLFRDAFQHSLVINQMDLDVTAYRPAVTYINGEYFGIYNLREKLDGQYLNTYHKVDPDNIDIIEFDFSSIPVVIAGDADHYNNMIQILQTLDLSQPQNYEWIKTQIDIDSYINFMITETYCDNINTLNTNVKQWREKSAGGKWRWLLLDMDWGFGTQYSGFSSHYSHNQLLNFTSAPGTFLAGWQWSTLLFRKMLENESFRNEFIQRFASYMNTTFKTERVLSILDSLQQQIAGEMPRHIDRWDEFTDIIYQYPAIPDMDTWNGYVDVMRTFGQNRTAYQRNHIVSFFNLSGSATITQSLNLPQSGKILINNVAVPDDFEGTYFLDIPVNLNARPTVGYAFVRWEGDYISTSDSISLVLNSNITLTAVFQETGESILPAVIESNTLLTLANSPYLVRNNLTVNSGVTLTVEAGVEIKMPEKGNIYIYGDLQVNGTAQLPAIISSNRNSGALTWGALIFEYGSAPSSLNHLTLEKATQGPDLVRHIAALSSYHSDLNINSLKIVDAPFPVFIQYGAIVVQNSEFHSNFTCDLINIKYASSALIENCQFRGNNSFDTDAIDYDQISNGIIRNNTIYNFYGSNSDGIDLGEGSRDIRIENNLIINVFDKGISVGQASTALISNNVIVNCAQGVGVKDDSSYADIRHGTFYGNGYAVASFEKNAGAGGGNISVVNSILSASKTAPFLLDDLSVLNISYTLSDTEILPGTLNLQASPQFLNNFRLNDISPAINSGDPASPTDPDGSRADMGAYPFDPDFQDYLIINEVHYNPLNGSNYEFIELYNSGPAAINLDGYQLNDALNYTFPSVTMLADAYLVVAADATLFNAEQYSVLQGISTPLSNYEATLILKDNNGAVIDRFSYSINENLPEYTNGQGSSLELKLTDLENSYYLNWRASFENGGSPGAENIMPLVSDIFINEIQAINTSTFTDEAGEYNDWIEIYNGSPNNLDVGGFYITDNISDPAKFKIPDTDPNLTSVEPGGFLILWADEQPAQGALHLPFKLSGAGEELALVQKLGDQFIIIDQLSYPAQNTDNSWGRLTDGAPEFTNIRFPTPGRENYKAHVFDKGILLVNGVSFPTYGEEIISAYQARAFWGRFPITFWDAFDAPENGYPSELPEPIGHGAIPAEILEQYSSVIWIGNNYAGDLDTWLQTDIENYIKDGGNLFLMTRYGETFINGTLQEYLGIRWQETEISLQSTISVYPSLNNIQHLGSQNLNAVFYATSQPADNTLLYTHTSNADNGGLGVWKKPPRGGAYKENGGQFVFLSGRPYRYIHAQIKVTCEFVLDEFFEEDDTVGTIEDPVFKYFYLSQNFPNPFNASTEIQFNVPHLQEISLSIYNILGQNVRTVRIAQPDLGINRYIWDGKNMGGVYVSSGVYFYRIKAGNFLKTKKMIYLR